MTLVVDASVIIKWLLKDPQREADTDKATQLMKWVAEGHEAVIQPMHWLMEVGAVLSRLSPGSVEDDIEMLQALDLSVDDNPPTLRRACRLAVDLQQHLFDTLYHAVALQNSDSIFITADEKYLRAATQLGGIMSLADWQPQ